METQPRELQAARLVWMLYYNRTLYERGVITEREYNAMRSRIGERDYRGKDRI